MTVSSYRASLPLSVEMSQVAPGALTLTSPFIQSWKASLQSIFLNEGGVFLLAQKILAKESSIYPYLYVDGQMSLDGRRLVWISLGRYELSTTWGFNELQILLISKINRVLKIIQDAGRDTKFIFREIFRVFIMPNGERRFGENQEERFDIYKHHFIQLVASLLNLYKDMLVGRGPILEGRKLQNLTVALEQLPEETCKEKACALLKQLILEVKKQMDADGVVSERRMCSFRANSMIKIFLKNIKGGDKNILSRCVQDLSLGSFSALVRHIPTWLPKIRLQHPLGEEAVLLVLMQKDPQLFLENISLNLLLKFLDAMLRNDVIYFLSAIPVVQIINVLKGLPIVLMKKMLLKMPKEIVCSLKKELSHIFLSRKIESAINQLKFAYQESLIPLNMPPKVVPSLLSLSVIKICQTSTRSIVSRRYSSLSLTYLNRMDVLYPDLQQEVSSQVRIITNSPRVGDAAQFSIEESPGEDYVPELDLFSLASMASGYDNCIRNILLEKCVNN